MSKAIAIIPARFSSTRFPGKVLADRTGKPLIQHVYERASQAASVEGVFVAADDQRIADAVTGFGGRAVMTRADHPNGTSRLAEAAERISAEATTDVIVNVQGDEPEIEPQIIDLAVSTLHSRDDCDVATIASPFEQGQAVNDPNIVKVVLDRKGRALYFSRAAIPFVRDRDDDRPAPPLRHVGLYVYRRNFLLTYPQLTPTPLEETEKLEQLRILEHGHRVAVAVAPTCNHGIDTPEQYESFVARWNAGAGDQV